VSRWQAGLSLLYWLIAALRYVVVTAMARDDSLERRAERLRAVIESLGPLPIKIAQQMSVRADVIPYEFCQEFAKMLDQVAPLPLATAVRVIEESIKRPLDSIFSDFDQKPVGSASLACVYQARRQDGRRVAVKVRRPGVAERLVAEILAFGWLLRFVETLGLLRAGVTRSIYHELKRTLLEELDFFREARNVELFRLRADETKQYHVDGPRIHFDLLSADVLVMDFVAGYFLTDIINAVDQNDTVTLAQLKTEGIEPSEIGRRLLHISHWQMLEGLLFHADPHPANIIVQPGNRIVFIDFGSCGHFSKKARRLWRYIYDCLEQEDVRGMVRGSIALLEPLPPIDLDQFTHDMEQLYWDWLHASKSQYAEWWQKASGMLWMKFAVIANRHSVPMSVEMLRVFRAIFLYDTAMVRLCKDLDFRLEYRRYQNEAGRRARRRVKRTIAKRFNGPRPRDYLAIEAAWRTGIRMFTRAQRLLDAEPWRFQRLMGKLAYTADVLLGLASFALLVFALVVAGNWAYTLITGKQLHIVDLVARIAFWPGTGIAAAMTLAVVLHRLRRKAKEPDTN
jgi:predicted unusual protein kinase regulating ubiquinone biosynthesis (AarF/ABC1/UbiB family)